MIDHASVPDWSTLCQSLLIFTFAACAFVLIVKKVFGPLWQKEQ